MNEERIRVQTCIHCSHVGGCDYTKTHKGNKPKLKSDFGGEDAVEIKPGLISVTLTWCGPFTLAPTPGRITEIQESMCTAFETGGIHYLTQKELNLIDNSKS